MKQRCGIGSKSAPEKNVAEKKTEKVPVKKKVRVRNPKKADKYWHEKQILPMYKNEKSAKKGFHAQKKRLLACLS